MALGLIGTLGSVTGITQENKKQQEKKKKEEQRKKRKRKQEELKKKVKATQNLISKCMAISTKNCASPFSDDVKIKKCPVMFTNTDAGKKCMSLYNEAMTKKKKINTPQMWDSAFENFCSKSANTDLYACKCLNAGKKGTSDSKIFNALNQANVAIGDVYCWYRYCKEPSDQQLHTIFLPYNYRHFNSKPCPAVKCANILNVKNSKIDTSKLRQSFSCSGDVESKSGTPYDSEQTNEASDSSLISNKGADKPTSTTYQPENSSRAKPWFANIWFVILIFFLVLVVVGLILILTFRRT